MIDLSKRLIFEGSMGTMLQAKGLKTGALPESWNITNPQAVRGIHDAYKSAGCDIAKTNTFGANWLKLAGSGYSVHDLVAAGVSIAKEAMSGGYAALSVGPTGKLLAPFGDLDFEDAVSCFAETIKAGAKAGADIILIETMNDTYEIKAAMLAAKENCNLPVFVTFTIDENGRMLTGCGIMPAVCMIEALGASALGFNCGFGPVQMKQFLPELARCSGIPVIVNPNAGMPTLVNGNTVFKVEPEEFALEMAGISKYAQIIGGCCGTTPAHMEAMKEKCKNIPVEHTTSNIKNCTIISSYSKSVVFGGGTVVIGERINPTGKPRMKKALAENDMDYLCNEGIVQVENGADILDVNVGAPGIDEKTALVKVVTSLQAVTNTPLQIDTTNPEAAEKALRLYNGRPLFNSVCGKEESLSKILPLAKKYGAAVVALTLDDAGIPETAEGRFEIAEKIVKRAEEYGLHKKNIIIDPLALTISTGSENAETTLRTVEMVKNKLGLHTVLGISNVSFGLPNREAVNQAFFTLAMNRGLSAGIINPNDKLMMDALFTYKALSGQDKNALNYVKRFGNSKEAKIQQKTPVLSLKEAIMKGMGNEAGSITDSLLTQISPMDIINTHLIPALDETGISFEKQIIFLPQLLMSAEAAKSAFESIKTYMAKHGSPQKKRGKVILATVKGDIHDIGKNIVKVLLENYNFEVIDLGKNVEPKQVVDHVLTGNASLVGLSALMTTTMPAMEETINLIKKAVPNCRIMVGGAVLTEDYAKHIGADFFAKDAMSGVRYAESVFNGIRAHPI